MEIDKQKKDSGRRKVELEAIFKKSKERALRLSDVVQRWTKKKLVEKLQQACFEAWLTAANFLLVKDLFYCIYDNFQGQCLKRKKDGIYQVCNFAYFNLIRFGISVHVAQWLEA